VRRFQNEVKPVVRAKRLELAESLAYDGQALADLAGDIADSRRVFGTQFAVSVPFYRPGERSIKPGRRVGLDRGDDVAVRLAGTWLVEGHPDHDFVHAQFGLAERRRSRTYQPWGYHGLPVLKGTTRRWFSATDATAPRSDGRRPATPPCT
jgi:hypothetical protein